MPSFDLGEPTLRAIGAWKPIDECDVEDKGALRECRDCFRYCKTVLAGNDQLKDWGVLFGERVKHRLYRYWNERANRVDRWANKYWQIDTLELKP